MMTVPGIGAITALAFKAALDDPKRFSSSSKVGPYLGLTPRQYQSGDSEWIGGIGLTNDPLLRSYLYEAAGVLMTRVRRSSPLKDWAIRLAKRIGWKRASIATARKLAVILHAIWRDGTVFEWQLANVTAP
jgi:transposase